MLQTLIFGLVVLVLDVPFIYLVMGNTYKDAGLFVNSKIRILPAICAYAIMISSYPLIIQKVSNVNNQLLVSAYLGGIIFGTYGFTLAAIYEKYPIYLAVMETLWGISLYSLSTFITNKLYTLI